MLYFHHINFLFCYGYPKCKTVDLLLGNETGKVNKILVGEHFEINGHNSISYIIIRRRDQARPQVKVLNFHSECSAIFRSLG